MKDKTLINQAFRELRKKGYFARQSFWCCQSCGWSAVPEDKAKKVVFYHKQDADHIKEGTIGNGGLYLAWAGNGKEIANTFTNLGFKVDWDGTDGKRICVHSQNNGG